MRLSCHSLMLSYRAPQMIAQQSPLSVAMQPLQVPSYQPQDVVASYYPWPAAPTYPSPQEYSHGGFAAPTTGYEGYYQQMVSILL